MGWNALIQVVTLALQATQIIDWVWPDAATPKCGDEAILLHTRGGLGSMYETLHGSAKILCFDIGLANETCVDDFRSVDTTALEQSCVSHSGKLLRYDYTEHCDSETSVTSSTLTGMGSSSNSNKTDADSVTDPTVTTTTSSTLSQTTREVFREPFCAAASCAGTAAEIQEFYRAYYYGTKRACDMTVHDVYAAATTAASSSSSFTQRNSVILTAAIAYIAAYSF
jgi:hypothetical protein